MEITGFSAGASSTICMCSVMGCGWSSVRCGEVVSVVSTVLFVSAEVRVIIFNNLVLSLIQTAKMYFSGQFNAQYTIHNTIP